MMKRHVPPDPLQVRLLCPVGQMAQPYPAASDLQQPRSFSRREPYPSTAPAHRIPGRHEWKQEPAWPSIHISRRSDRICPVVSSPYV